MGVNEIGAKFFRETSGCGYERIRKVVGNHLCIPSNHVLNTQLPMKVESTKHKFKKSNKAKVKEEEIDIKLFAMSEQEQQGKKKDEEHEDTIMLQINSDFGTEVAEDGEEVHVAIGAKLEGMIGASVDALVSKFNKKDKTKINDKAEIILLSSFDGAEALKTKKKMISVISFSTSLLTTWHIQNKICKAGQSCNILTWMQVVGKEDIFFKKGMFGTAVLA